MISTPAARICGPPMPNSTTSRRRFRAVARRAAYMSPEASPAERSKDIGGMNESSLYYPTNAKRTRSDRFCLPRRRKGRVFRAALLIARWCRRGEHRRPRPERGSFSRQLLFLVLELVEPVIDPTLGQKLLVRAFLAQAAFVEDEDAVRMLNRAQAVRDHQRRASAEEFVQGLPDHELGFRIHAGGGFIENQELRIVR